ncbi:unnamed protein product [Closterium sp. NIES-54]
MATMKLTAGADLAEQQLGNEEALLILPHGYDPDEEDEPAYCFFAPTPEEPASMEEALAGPDREKWLVSMDDEYQSLLENGTWDLVVLPEGKKAVQCKWVLRDKGQVTIYKSRLVANGCMQKEKQDFNEIFAPTAKPPILRVLLADATVTGNFFIQIDISTAFLNEILEEDVNMTQTPGYEDGTGRVCKLNKSIYGLKQVPRRCRSMKEIQKVQQQLMKNFKCKTLGEVKYYIGMHVERDLDHRWLNLHQEKFIKELGEKYGIENERKVATPLPVEFKLVKAAEDEGVEREEQQKFQSLVGTLLYAAVHTRPDISFSSIGVQYSASAQVKQKGVEVLKEKGERLGEGKLFLTCFTDATWASEKDDSSSVGGYICVVGGGPVSWMSKKQTQMALSSVESEYMAMFHGVKEVIWLRILLEEIGQEQQVATPLFSDSKGALGMARNAVLHGLNKHMRIKWHWLRKEVNRGTVNPIYIKTYQQPADFVTKSLADEPHSHCFSFTVSSPTALPLPRPYRSSLLPVPLPPHGPAPSGATSGGAASGGAEYEGAGSGGAEPGGEEPWGAEHAGVELGGAKPDVVEPGGAESEGAGSGGAEPWGVASSGGPACASPRLSPQQLCEWLAWRARPGCGATRAGGAGDVGATAGGAREHAGAGGTGGTVAAGPGGARTRAGGAGGTVWPRPYFVPLLQQVLGVPSSTSLTPPLMYPLSDQSQSPLLSASPLPSPSLTLSSPAVLHCVPVPVLATTVTDPSFESAAASALVAKLLDFAVACRLDYDTALVAESASAIPPSVGGECDLGTDVIEDWQEDFESLAAAVPHFASMLLAPKGDPDAQDIPTLCSYTEAITGPYSSQWLAAMDAEMASWNQRHGVDYFQTFSPTPKMTTLRMLVRVAAQGDYELDSLDFSTAFLQGSLHDEIWLRRPPGFTGSFPAGTQWSLRWPVYGLRQVSREWHETLRTTFADLGLALSTAHPLLFLCTDTSLPPFYILVYVDDLVFATADSEALILVKSEPRRDKPALTWVLQRFGFQFSLPQPTPLSTGHSLSAPPSDEFIEPSGPYPDLVGCLMYLMTCTRPDLAYPLSLLARKVSPGRHRKAHWDGAKRVLRYLCSTPGMGLVLGGRGPAVLTGHVDASWANDSATQRSSHSCIFNLGSGSVSWQSTRSSSVLSSSCEAEIYAGAMAVEELRWLTYLLTDLGEQPRSPPVLYVDNKAMIALCQEHRLEHRTNHIAMRYFLAQELQQRCDRIDFDSRMLH